MLYKIQLNAATIQSLDDFIHLFIISCARQNVLIFTTSQKTENLWWKNHTLSYTTHMRTKELAETNKTYGTMWQVIVDLLLTSLQFTLTDD